MRDGTCFRIGLCLMMPPFRRDGDITNMPKTIGTKQTKHDPRMVTDAQTARGSNPNRRA